MSSVNKNWVQVNTIWKYCHGKKWKHKSYFQCIWLFMDSPGFMGRWLTTDKWTRCYLQPVRTLTAPLLISNCKFSCLQLTVCHLIANFFPITILWSSTSGLQYNFLLCRLIIEHMTGTPYLMVEWHMFPKFSFIYLFA